MHKVMMHGSCLSIDICTFYLSSSSIPCFFWFEFWDLKSYKSSFKPAFFLFLLLFEWFYVTVTILILSLSYTLLLSLVIISKLSVSSQSSDSTDTKCSSYCCYPSRGSSRYNICTEIDSWKCKKWNNRVFLKPFSSFVSKILSIIAIISWEGWSICIFIYRKWYSYFLSCESIL